MTLNQVFAVELSKAFFFFNYRCPEFTPDLMNQGPAKLFLKAPQLILIYCPDKNYFL